MSFYNNIIQEIPAHLREFIVEQNYERYTPQDHAVWRYIMRRNLSFLKKHAHPAYMDGLRKTGISLEHIPHIDEVNSCLSAIGWKAVIVDGFLPPAVFMEFQYHKILVISADIRSLQHILYTPAPDIVHEAAGHAPIIADETYSYFLQKFGEYGMKAFSSIQDMEIYEAIRHLSIIKEYPGTHEDAIMLAEKDLEQKIAKNTNPSEMTKLSRLHWWTVEYGLIGTIDKFKLYGAGLLSSVGESKNCISSAVKKIPLTVDCVNYNYDITKEQPQLFVNKDWQHLIDVLEEYADSMAFRTGGLKSVELAVESKQEATVVLSSGLQISGIFEKCISDTMKHPAFIKTTGPTSLAYNNRQVAGHGTDYHNHGYSTPLGLLSGTGTPTENLSEKELKKLGIAKNKKCELKFRSGIVLKGILTNIFRNENKILIMSFDKCTVKNNMAEELFNPDWGMFDLAVGAEISSVFFGTADKEKHNVYPSKSKNKAITIEYSNKDKILHKYYTEIERMKSLKEIDKNELDHISKSLTDTYPDNWLIRVEMLALLQKKKGYEHLTTILQSELGLIAEKSEENKDVIESAVNLLN